MDKSLNWRDRLPAIFAILVMVVFPYLLPSDLRMIAPPIGFSVIFFWSQQQELSMRMPVWVAMICGILLDVMQLMPVGIGISAALLLYWLAHLREGRKDFAGNMLRYGWVSAMTMLWIYLLMSLVQGQFFPPMAPLFQWVALVVSYPLIYSFCHAMHRHMDKLSAHHNL